MVLFRHDLPPLLRSLSGSRLRNAGRRRPLRPRLDPGRRMADSLYRMEMGAVVAQPMNQSYDQPPPDIICEQCRQSVQRVSRYHWAVMWLCCDCLERSNQEYDLRDRTFPATAGPAESTGTGDPGTGFPGPL